MKADALKAKLRVRCGVDRANAISITANAAGEAESIVVDTKQIKYWKQVTKPQLISFLKKNNLENIVINEVI